MPRGRGVRDLPKSPIDPPGGMCKKRSSLDGFLSRTKHTPIRGEMQVARTPRAMLVNVFPFRKRHRAPSLDRSLPRFASNSRLKIRRRLLRDRSDRARPTKSSRARALRNSNRKASSQEGDRRPASGSAREVRASNHNLANASHRLLRVASRYPVLAGSSSARRRCAAAREW